jgi:hypothetical protein
MGRPAVRHQVVAALLGAREPLTLAEVVAQCGAGRQAVLSELWRLTEEGGVVEDWLTDLKPGPQYAWAGLRPTGEEPESDGPPDIESDLVAAFHDFVVSRYEPPPDKPFLVFFQCAVRRPFSKAPSHASLRRAVSVATGFDPAREFERCPVHVVVLASRIGPVPYELEDFPPVNVRSNGVPHFGPAEYARARPILARRVADYLESHGAHYRRIAAFGARRYGEVLRDAARLAGVEFPIFPAKDGPAVARLGGSLPKSYWEKYWIQLAREIEGWLPEAERAAVMARLAELGVEVEE